MREVIKYFDAEKRTEMQNRTNTLPEFWKDVTDFTRCFIIIPENIFIINDVKLVSERDLQSNFYGIIDPSIIPFERKINGIKVKGWLLDYENKICKIDTVFGLSDDILDTIKIKGNPTYRKNEQENVIYIHIN